MRPPLCGTVAVATALAGGPSTDLEFAANRAPHTAVHRPALATRLTRDQASRQPEKFRCVFMKKGG
jgi:hypothetical protein